MRFTIIRVQNILTDSVLGHTIGIVNAFKMQSRTAVQE